MIAGKFTKNSIKILGFREKSYIKWKHQLHNKFKSFSVKLVCAKTWITAAEQPTDPRNKDLGYF